MRWLITGAGGMLGTDLRAALSGRDEPVAGLSRGELDVTDSRLVTETVLRHSPDVIVNCAAYTKVDLAETDEATANIINGSAVELLASAANEAGALLVQVSTDFVFDGADRSDPYETDDPAGPLSAYGRSKLLGEVAASHAEEHLIVRTSWLFGVHGPNFVEAIRGLIRKGVNPLTVVADQRGRPTYTPHLARAIIRLVHANARGIAHYADEEACTWFDFATAIVGGTGVDVKPVTSDQFPRPAKRPAYSVLSTALYEELTGAQPESWRDGLREYLALRA